MKVKEVGSESLGATLMSDGGQVGHLDKSLLDKIPKVRLWLTASFTRRNKIRWFTSTDVASLSY